MVKRSEYPRPQFVRENWLNLNGTWEFEIDHGASGEERQLFCADHLDDHIEVPFCPESKLSGVGYTDFMASVWYRRTFEVPEEWAGKRVLLHFGAVDYDCSAWINGIKIGTHQGGSSSFTFEITQALQAGKNVIVVNALDDTRSMLQPLGKQSFDYYSHNCNYTRTTGIWQTVWLEAVPATYMERPRLTPDLDNSSLHIEQRITGPADGLRLEARAFADGKLVATGICWVSGGWGRLTLKIDEVRAWSPQDPFLYDLNLKLVRDTGDDQALLDSAYAYFGLRSVDIRGLAVLLNGEPVFQRLVLDQGFYPDGIWTAPSDDELRLDVERGLAMGFNGARLHQKVFEERYLYWCDCLGYLVWGEYPSWGIDVTLPEATLRYATEWQDIMARDYNHPAIVGWCPFNETIDRRIHYVDMNPHDARSVRLLYEMTKRYDMTRPVVDASGYTHVITDLFDVHDYDQNPATFAERYRPLAQGGEAFVRFPEVSSPYMGQPYWVSEYGGIWWDPAQAAEGWGYGERPTSEAEFIERYRGLTEALLNHPAMCAFCYTQLTDVEQEVNGLYTYDRKPKFDPEIIRAINAQPAAIEKKA